MKENKSEYIDASPEAGKAFYQNFHNKGKVEMLNLFKFKAIANYSDLEEIKPSQIISGEEAYQLYMDCILPESE